MDKLQCHSGTSYKEIWDFINSNLGKTVEFHYEIQGYPTWGNDEVDEIILNEKGLEWIHNYMGTEYSYRTDINGAYVHNITVIND